MTPGQERWAEALAVIEIRGDATETFVSERLAALARNMDGILKRQEIGRRIARLQDD